MVVTTWDGHVRVDYVRDFSSLQVTLATVQPTKEAELRRGLRAGFVRDDPDGPPAFVEVKVEGGRVPADVRDLLGDRLLAEAQRIIDGPARSRWLRINLRTVDELAEAWAPYRPWILADEPAGPAAAADPEPVLGRLARGLWSRLGVGDLRDALSRPLNPELQFRSARDDDIDDLDDDIDEDDDEDGDDEVGPPTASGRWALPVELARRTGVEPTLVWEVYGDLRVHLTARRAAAASSDPPALEIAFDDGAERWARFIEPEPGLLRASLVSAADAAHLPEIKVRTGSPT